MGSSFFYGYGKAGLYCLPANIGTMEELGMFHLFNTLISILLRFFERLSLSHDDEHAAAVGEQLAVFLLHAHAEHLLAQFIGIAERIAP